MTIEKKTFNPEDSEPEIKPGPDNVEQAPADENLKARLKEAEEKALRLAADFENSKKRLRAKSDELIKYANEKILTDLLDVIDNLDRAILSLDQGHDVESIKKGLHMVQVAFHQVMDQNGIKPIEALKQPFDPNFHEAVGEVKVDDDSVEEGHIVEEIQRGYLLNGRLARPSRVRIAKKE